MKPAGSIGGIKMQKMPWPALLLCATMAGCTTWIGSTFGGRDDGLHPAKSKKNHLLCDGKGPCEVHVSLWGGVHTDLDPIVVVSNGESNRRQAITFVADAGLELESVTFEPNDFTQEPISEDRKKLVVHDQHRAHGEIKYTINVRGPFGTVTLDPWVIND